MLTDKQTRLPRFMTQITLLILAIPALLPLIWMLSTSLKADDQIFGSGVAITWKTVWPHPFVFKNYPEALKAIPMAMYLRNTLKLCFFNVFGAVLSSAMVAYGFARLEFKGKSILFMIMIATMALPAQVTMIPNFVLFRWLGWYGTYLPLTVPAFFGMPFFIFLLTQFYKTLPSDLSEAAWMVQASLRYLFASCCHWRVPR